MDGFFEKARRTSYLWAAASASVCIILFVIANWYGSFHGSRNAFLSPGHFIAQGFPFIYCYRNPYPYDESIQFNIWASQWYGADIDDVFGWSTLALGANIIAGVAAALAMARVRQWQFSMLEMLIVMAAIACFLAAYTIHWPPATFAEAMQSARCKHTCYTLAGCGLLVGGSIIRHFRSNRSSVTA